ncbi:MAG: PilZ domain-containing protein, partial [Lysobacterales bacterium]
MDGRAAPAGRPIHEHELRYVQPAAYRTDAAGRRAFRALGRKQMGRRGRTRRPASSAGGRERDLLCDRQTHPLHAVPEPRSELELISSSSAGCCSIRSGREAEIHGRCEASCGRERQVPSIQGAGLQEHAMNPGSEPPSGQSDRRRNPRASMRGRASVLIAGGGAIEGETVDISDSGVCLTLPTALQLGDLYRLNLEMRTDPLTEVTIVGRVCFCIQQSA